MRLAVLPEAETEALKSWAKESRLTLSTVAQGAWALVLSRYSGEETWSSAPRSPGGRRACPGSRRCWAASSTPCRCACGPTGARVAAWLQVLQAEQVELRRYEHSPLVEVLGWSDVPRPTPLFESIFVFEGFTETPREGRVPADQLSL